MEEWKVLKHKKVIKENINYLNATEILFPVSLRKILDKLNSELVLINNKRNDNIKNLFSLKIKDISTVNVNKYIEIFNEISEDEQKITELQYNNVNENISERKECIKTRKEEFRRQLHKYEALVKEVIINTFC